MKEVFKKHSCILLIIFFVISCNSQPKVPSIEVKDLHEIMSSDSNLVILDVRTPQELIGPLGKLEGVINIPVQELSERVDELSEYNNKTIAVICRTGNRSTYSTKILIENNFAAYNVLGGMKDYRSKYGVKK